MYLGRLLYRFVDIVRGCTATEVNCNGMLACSYIDNGWRGREESGIFCEIAYSKGSRHDDQPKGLYNSVSINAYKN